MPLKPNIASYNSNFHKMKSNLTEDLLQIIYGIATDSINTCEIEDKTLNDLEEMHVIKREHNTIKLATTVFLEKDIERISALASNLGEELADTLIKNCKGLDSLPPEIKTFLGGIIGITQGLSTYNFKQNIGSEWKNYTGNYAKTKVDFDEICPSYNSIGEHLFNKRILVGKKYTAVFIGPGENNFTHIFNTLSSSPENKDYIRNLLKHLTDSYGLLLEGKLHDEYLMNTAEQVNIFQNGKLRDILITKECFYKHLPSIEKITQMTCEYYSGKLELIFETLSKTTSGRHGVSPENMLMHFWRYFSRVLAQKLYESGFLDHHISSLGSITVFYDNEIPELKESFS